MNIEVNINRTIEDSVKKIQSARAYPGQYFAFFQNIYGSGVDQNLSGRMGMTPGPVLIMVFLLALVLWINKKTEKEMKYLTVFSAVMLFVASDLFPWDYLAANWSLGMMMSQIQFPWRYIGIAVLLLTMLFGCILQSFSREMQRHDLLKNMYVSAVGQCLFMSFFYVSSCADYAGTVYFYDTAELSTYSVGNGEYVRAGADINAFTRDISEENMQRVVILSRRGQRMEIYCETGAESSSVEVPILNYKGYCVIDEFGNTYDLEDGDNRLIRFSVPGEFSGKVMIDFVEPWYWRMGELISAVAVLILCVRKVLSKKQKKQKKQFIPMCVRLFRK